MSCIHLDDLARMIFWCFKEEKMQGIFNATMPTPITNSNFTKTLAKILHRPALLKIPAWALRFFLRDFSHLFLDSQRVVPKRALDAGFQFQYPSTEEALKSFL